MEGKDVATFSVAISVGDMRGEKFEEMEALVDTGATTTVIPGAALRRLGIAPTRRGRSSTLEDSE